MRCPLRLIGVLVLTCIAMQASDGWRPLWNGRDLAGWRSWLRAPEPTSVVPGIARGADGKYTAPLGPDRDPLKVFTVVEVDGRPAIRISGEAFGELRTVESFSNYRLRLQFKWGTKKWPPRNAPATPRDSGLLYHIHSGPGTVWGTWPRSFEFQIEEHDVGDLYAVGSEISVRSHPLTTAAGKTLFVYDPQGEWRSFSQIPGKQEGRCVKQPDNEKPTGEWNVLELVCCGEDCVHIVNGRVVMRLHGPRRIDGVQPAEVTSGPVLLQSEGSEVFYRDIEVQPITAIPPEYAEH